MVELNFCVYYLLENQQYRNVSINEAAKKLVLITTLIQYCGKLAVFSSRCSKHSVLNIGKKKSKALSFVNNASFHWFLENMSKFLNSELIFLPL